MFRPKVVTGFGMQEHFQQKLEFSLEIYQIRNAPANCIMMGI